MDKQPNVFEYSEYRLYIRVWLAHSRKAKGLNLTGLAEVVQVHPTFLSHVLSGSKDLSLEQAALMSRHISHTRLEQEYFFTILQLNRAGSKLLTEILLTRKKEIESEKNRLTLRFEKHKQLTDEQRAIFYSSWVYVAIWAATGIRDGQTVSSIAKMFSITRAKSEEILSFLSQTGLCNEKDENFTPGEVHVHVPNESPFVVKHHTNWRMKAIQRMDDRDSAELFFSAPMSLGKKEFDVIRERMNRVIKEVVTLVKDCDAEEVVCLNIDFFKVCEPD
jgi:uncharacterized protein (TIGR02147 family)